MTALAYATPSVNGGCSISTMMMVAVKVQVVYGAVIGRCWRLLGRLKEFGAKADRAVGWLALSILMATLSRCKPSGCEYR